MVFWVVALVMIGFAAYVRLAPSDPVRWHVAREGAEARTFKGGAIRVVEGELAALDKIARAEPRTRVLAGSVEEGMITYVTRSKLWGFPDYTTVWQEGGKLVLSARLRFGSSDLGVNAARLERWLAQL